MDLIRWQRRSVVLSCFPLPLGARPLAFVLRPPEKTGHKSALFVRNVALKEKKKEKKKDRPTQRRIFPGAHVRPDAALWLTYQPLCCVVRYFFMYYI